MFKIDINREIKVVFSCLVDALVVKMDFVEKKLTRADSIDSLPDAEFLCPSAMMKLLDQPTQSEFKRMEAEGRLIPEPMLMEDKSRFVLFPIKQPDVCILNFYQYAFKSFKC